MLLVKFARKYKKNTIAKRKVTKWQTMAYTTLKTGEGGVNSGALDEYPIPAPLVKLVVLLWLQIR
jgi:hypothetical protein